MGNIETILDFRHKRWVWISISGFLLCIGQLISFLTKSSLRGCLEDAYAPSVFTITAGSDLHLP